MLGFYSCFLLGVKWTWIPELKTVTNKPKEHQRLVLGEDSSRACKVLCVWS